MVSRYVRAAMTGRPATTARAAMTAFVLDGPATRFLYYLLDGHAGSAHDDYDDPKAVEAKLPLPCQRVCVLKRFTRDTKNPPARLNRTAVFFCGGFFSIWSNATGFALRVRLAGRTLRLRPWRSPGWSNGSALRVRLSVENLARREHSFVSARRALHFRKPDSSPRRSGAPSSTTGCHAG